MTKNEMNDNEANGDLKLSEIEQEWHYIKWLISKGICPFDEWFDEGLVVMKKELVNE